MLNNENNLFENASSQLSNENLSSVEFDSVGNIVSVAATASTISMNSNNENKELKEKKIEGEALVPFSRIVDESENCDNNKEDATKKDKYSDIKLKMMDVDFVYELMSVPTYSKFEYRLVTFIILFAKKNKIKYEIDSYGNIYLTKGELNEGEFYPCMTAHMDSVQNNHKPYILAGCKLNVKTRTNTKGNHEIYVDGMGIGGDDKAGVLIGLSMFKHCDKLKAAFFLEEEIGCLGSNNLNKDWFKDVGYVLGYDSPDKNRAAWACSGVKLFSKDFFDTYMKDVCANHGLTIFRSEPFTDVKVIREKTDIICMNFGSGYYGAHSSTEYCNIEEMDDALAMGKDLIDKIGLTQHILVHEGIKYNVNDEDEKYFNTLGGYSRYYGNTYNYSKNYNNNYGGYDYGSSSNQSTLKNIEVKGIPYETVEYIADVYEKYIERIKNNVKTECEKHGINFDEFYKNVFTDDIKF